MALPETPFERNFTDKQHSSKGFSGHRDKNQNQKILLVESQNDNIAPKALILRNWIELEHILPIQPMLKIILNNEVTAQKARASLTSIATTWNMMFVMGVDGVTFKDVTNTCKL